jgi:hypothetical protein
MARSAWFIASLLSLIGLIGSGCVEPRVSLGNLSLRPYHAINQTIYSYGVQEGRLVSGAVDVAIDPDGCARGEVAPGAMVVLCPKELKGEPLEAGGKLVRWSGVGGDLVTELAADGRKLRADGFIGLGRANRQVHVTLRLYRGQPWDELREHPVLYAVAAATSGMQGEPPDDDPGL